MAIPTKNQVARWAGALTLGRPVPIADNFNTTAYFEKAPLRFHYAAVFNGATATQVQNVSPFNWICCIQPEDLQGITTGAALVNLVEKHLTEELKAAANAARVAAAAPKNGVGAETDKGAGAAEIDKGGMREDGGDMQPDNAMMTQVDGTDELPLVRGDK
ncbi:MAG TPA: hypothetical protein VE010_14220 [Thermoanaerobaculia bacterium]|nr:hypothetical protein [Thermoanaerobaculia bacterium]